MNRIVKLLLLLLTLTFSSYSPCFASWSNDDDDLFGYYSFDLDNDGEDDLWVTTNEEGHGTGIGYINDEGLFEYEVIGNSGSETDCNDDGGTDASWENEETEDEDPENGTESEVETNIGSYHPDNNKCEITVPLQPMHIPVEGEVLFIDKLPAQSMKQGTNMDCVPTAVANLLSHMGSEQSSNELRENIEKMYDEKFRNEVIGVKVIGVTPEHLGEFLTSLNFVQTPFSEFINNRDTGALSVGVIETKDGLHMVEIVGYYNDQWVGYGHTTIESAFNAYQCINPGTGKFETHYAHEFYKYKDWIYTKY